MRFIENHDQQRAAFRIPDHDALTAVTALTYLLPGIPLIYNGAEVALTHRLELFDVDAIDWSAGSLEFRLAIKEVLALRRQQPALTRGVYNPAPTGQPQVLAFVREWQSNQVAVAVNFQDTAVQVSQDSLGSDLHLGSLLFSLGDVFLTEATLELPPWGMAVIKLDK